MKITGSQAVIESLLKEKVEVIFGYPGGANMPIYDALYDYSKKIRHVLVRHEQGAAHAAEGYARVTGKAGVCFATSGPGATNLVTGIADAMLDSVPLVCITGQVAAHLIGTDAFQETDVVGITTPITKWNYQITKVEEIPKIMAKAFFIAQNGRPGPVVVDITKDVQFQTFDFVYPKNYKVKKILSAMPPLKSIKKAAEIINQAKKPYLIVGHGALISKAGPTLSKFSQKAGIPVASTLHGLGAVPTSHKNYVGMVGMHGHYSPNKLTNQADVIVAVGMRFDDRVTSTIATYAPRAKVIHIDIDASEINKNIKTYIGLVGDAKTILTKMFRFLKKRNHGSWIGEFKKLDLHAKKITDSRPKKQKITMDEVISLISKKTKGEAIIVADVGQNQMFSARFYEYKNPNSYITSGGLGTMGFALPAALGAQIASPKSLVIATIGDGGFQMTIQEMGTIFQEKLPIKILVLNNEYLGMVRQWQEMFFEKRYSFTHLENPDFIAISKGYGIPARQVKERVHLEKEITEFLNARGPVLLEVRVEQENNIFPMIPSGAAVDEVRIE
jgi:acetolactate synthase-1/2/3 large subunit